HCFSNSPQNTRERAPIDIRGLYESKPRISPARSVAAVSSSLLSEMTFSCSVPSRDVSKTRSAECADDFASFEKLRLSTRSNFLTISAMTPRKCASSSSFHLLGGVVANKLQMDSSHSESGRFESIDRRAKAFKSGSLTAKTSASARSASDWRND